MLLRLEQASLALLLVFAASRACAVPLPGFPLASSFDQSLAQDAPDPDDSFWSDRFFRAGLDHIVLALAAYHGDLYASGQLLGPCGDVSIERWDGKRWAAVQGAPDPWRVLAFTVYDGCLVVAGTPRPFGATQTGILRWDGSRWDSLGQGVDGVVSSLAVQDEYLVVGGSFRAAGGVPVSNIARWNGTSWDSLGAGLNGLVSALAVYDGRIIAGGSFSWAGPVAARFVARWDGAAWEPLGAGTDGRVAALLASNGSLYAGGSFRRAGAVAAEAIARWDGSNWYSLGDGLQVGVSSLAEYQGNLIAAGTFTASGSLDVKGVARWDGMSWSGLGAGLVGNVRALQILGDRLIAGASPQSTIGEHVASWDGSSWSSLGPMGAGVNRSVTAMLEYEGDLIAGGGFSQAGYIGAGRVARWDGERWDPLGNGVNLSVRALAVYKRQLIAMGYAGPADSAQGIALWDGNAWKSLGSGFVGIGWAMTVHDGELIVGGSFQKVGEMSGLSIARWNGSRWDSLGPGLSGTVYALAVYRGDLIAGGRFESRGYTRHLARWDGRLWSYIDQGLDETLPGFGISTLAVWGEALVVAGRFRPVGWEGPVGIAAWNGTRWDSLGSGPPFTVSALGVHAGQLIAGGGIIYDPFPFAMSAGDSPAMGIARWDGASWKRMGSGICGYVYALAPVGTKLYVGGSFLRAGAKRSTNIALWDDAPPPTPGSRGPALAPPAPNPSAERAEFAFSLPAPAPVRLTIHDIQGRTVAILVDGPQASGPHSISWTGQSAHGGSAGPGVYLVRLESRGQVRTRKFVHFAY